MRWRIAVLVSAAIAISYLDRQTLPVAIRAIGHDIPLSNQQFSYLQSAFLLAYAFMYAGGGKLADILGTRRGFTVIMLFWSLACLSHGLATNKPSSRRMNMTLPDPILPGSISFASVKLGVLCAPNF